GARRPHPHHPRRRGRGRPAPGARVLLQLGAREPRGRRQRRGLGDRRRGAPARRRPRAHEPLRGAADAALRAQARPRRFTRPVRARTRAGRREHAARRDPPRPRERAELDLTPRRRRRHEDRLLVPRRRRSPPDRVRPRQPVRLDRAGLRLRMKPLPPGGTIGVPAPASPYENRSDVLRGIEWWESKGYRVKLSEAALARDDYVAGDAQQRARDLEAMFADPEVDVVQALQGGYGSFQTLPHLDFDVVARNP